MSAVIRRLLRLPLPLLLLLFSQLPLAVAQIPVENPSLPSDSSSFPTTLSTIASSLASTLSSTALPRITSDSAPSTATNAATGPIDPDDDDDDDEPGTSAHDWVLNYYYLFIALFLLLVCALAYWIHRRYRRRKALLRRNSQNALARDMDGWTSRRRWVHGHWRGDSQPVARADEGLNERGEAPPPYMPPAGQEAGTTGGQDGMRDVQSGLAVPLRTLSRDGAGMKPPDYEEAQRSDSASTSRPGTADASTRPA